MKTRTIEIQDLLAHEAGLRALAQELVGREGWAEDVVQETWLVALRDAGEVRNPGAWLRAVVRRLSGRLRRGEGRRRDREIAAAQAEYQPSVDAILEREASRRLLMDCVCNLPEPARTTLLLRYMEGLPPREIGRRMTVPVETVRTRIRRALQQVRDALGGSEATRAEDQGRNWKSVCTMAHARTGPSGLVGRRLMGVMMTTKAKAAAVACVLALAIPLFWFMLRDERVAGSHPLVPGNTGAPREAEHGEAQRAESADAVLPLKPYGEVGAEGSGKPLPSGPEHLVGSVRVRVRNADMKPVPDRDIHLLALSERQHSARNVWGRTNVDGIAAFAELRPGKVWLTSPLGGMASTQVVAGEVAEVDIDLAPGFTVAGRVVDDQGIGVAGARILVHGVGFSEEARVVARSGSDGRFEFGEMVTKSFGRIGARADGHAPSTMVFTSGAPGSVQELTLVLPGPGGRVRGTVRTPKGDPVAEARVRIGSDDHGQTTAPDGRQQDTAEPVLAMTDADGRFSLDGLAPGRQTMKVTARGWAPVQQVVDVRAGATVDIALALDAGVTLEGEVVDASGDPVGDARIQAFLGNDRVAVGARSAPDGRFTLEALPPGSLRLEVWSKEKGRAERTIDGVSGEVLRWTARLAEQPTIEGVVVDSLDDALEGWRVEARTVRKGLVFILTGVTDAEGRFVIEDCSENSYHVTAQAPALGALVAMEEHTVGQVKPGGPPIRIVVPRTAPPTATITGRVVLPDGSSAGNAQLDLARAEHTNSQTFHVDAETGAFTLGPLRSGRYRLSFEAPGYAASSLTIDDLKHDEVRDLGPLTLRQGGQVRARLHGVPLDATPSEFWLVTTPLASGPRRGLSALGGTALSASLPAGRYTLDVGGSVVASARHPFTIQEGVVTELDVDILRGVLQILRPVNLPPGVEATNLRMRMTDARGGLVADGGFWNEGPQGDRVRRLALVPGATYRIEVSVPGVDEPRVFDIHTTEVVDHVHTLSL